MLGAAVVAALALFWWLRRPQTTRSGAVTALEEPITIPRDRHSISRRNISDNALKVLYRLRSQGYQAYLVGGCVRDLLLGQHPKDFDVTTDATPEQVRRIFRNSRIIGRRFRLVHVTFGREMIEVATFRASHDQVADQQRAQQSAKGRILRDNVFGTVEEDAARRDFTINALYYNIEDFSILDFAHGMRDLEARRVRLLGDPARRYEEDPVRMLRAVRFAAKLDFSIDPASEAPLCDKAPLLRDVPAARLFDEVLKLLMHGQGEQTFDLLLKYRLFDALFPATAKAIEDDADGQLEMLIRLALRNTDTRIRQDKPVSPSFLFACLLWGPLQRCWEDLKEQGIAPVPALQQAAMVVLENQCNHTAIPKRISMPLREIWDLQGRLLRRPGKRCFSLVRQARFRAAYDLMMLREASGEEGLGDINRWWTDFQQANEREQEQLLNQVDRPKRARRRRRPVKRKSGGQDRS